MSLELTIKQAFSVVDLSLFKPRFSPSALPFCPRKFVIHSFATDDLIAMSAWGYDGEFYAGQGHVIHAVTQKQLGKAGLLFGDWSCCGITRCHQKSERCLVCGNWPTYREFQLDKAMNGIGGFVDGVLLDHNAVLEIKTKSSYRIESMTEPIWYEWTMQASVYATALNRMYGWNLDKIVMLYISRENPYIQRIFVVPVIKASLEGQLALQKQGKDCVRLKVLPSGICNNSSEGDDLHCVYASVCFRPDLASKLKLEDESTPSKV